MASNKIAAGSVDTITYPNGTVIKRNYHDVSGALESVSRGNVTLWQAKNVDEFGHVTQERFGNNVYSYSAYDNRRGTLMGMQTTLGQQMMQIQMVNPGQQAATSSNTLQHFNYDYDAIGNMKHRIDSVVGYTESFQYDNLNRLTHVRDAGNVLQQSYTYDEIGNITYKSGVGTYAYDPNHVHAVSSVTGTLNNTYSYDSNGNMLSGAGRNFEWTTFNKPSLISTANGSTEYGYDAGHNRVWKRAPVVGGFEITRYVGKIFEQRVLNTLTKDIVHVYAGSKLIASIESVAGSETLSYMHADHLGSVNLITNDQGGIVERLRFDVFGAPVDPKTGAALTGATADAKFGTTTTTRGYTGHEMDASTGLINMNARLYDPVLGRFISADTVIPEPGNMQAFNRYAYVLNNPLMYTDPTGHIAFTTILIIGALTGAANAALNGGSFADIIMGAAIGAVLAGVSYGAFTGLEGTLGGFFAGLAAGGVAGGVGGVFGTQTGDNLGKNITKGTVSGVSTSFAQAMLGRWAGAYIAGWWEGGSDDARKALHSSVVSSFIQAGVEVKGDYIESDVAATGREQDGDWVAKQLAKAKLYAKSSVSDFPESAWGQPEVRKTPAQVAAEAEYKALGRDVEVTDAVRVDVAKAVSTISGGVAIAATAFGATVLAPLAGGVAIGAAAYLWMKGESPAGLIWDITTKGTARFLKPNHQLSLEMLGYGAQQVE